MSATTAPSDPPLLRYSTFLRSWLLRRSWRRTLPRRARPARLSCVGWLPNPSCAMHPACLRPRLGRLQQPAESAAITVPQGQWVKHPSALALFLNACCVPCQLNLVIQPANDRSRGPEGRMQRLIRKFHEWLPNPCPTGFTILFSMHSIYFPLSVFEFHVVRP